MSAREAALPSNNVPAIRQPRLVIVANGVPLAAPLSAEIVSNNHHAADRFHATAALPAPPDAAMWAATADIAIDIRVALTAGQPATSLIQGVVDSVEIDAVSGLLHIAGRDRTAALIEARTQETFANLTASEIAILLAGRHGLTPEITATTTPVGRYWQLEHDRITLDQFTRASTEWDLLTSLASQEGFDVWVGGTTLYFHPSVALVPNPLPAAILNATATPSGPANVTGLRLERALTLAREIEVTVKSWHSRQQAACVQTARGTAGARSGGKPLHYVYVVPNLTPDAALQLAQRRLVELTRHERVIVAEMPGELTLTPRLPIAIAGTCSTFDQLYWIDEIERSLHWKNGFTQRVHARNISSAVGG